MPEAEAMRLFHGIVDMAQLERRLKHKLSHDADHLLEEVRLFVGVDVHICVCKCV